jgi:hypothetical protein
LRRWLCTLEIIAAVRVTAFGRWWAAAAVARLGKLSGKYAE